MLFSGNFSGKQQPDNKETERERECVCEGLEGGLVGGVHGRGPPGPGGPPCSLGSSSSPPAEFCESGFVAASRRPPRFTHNPRGSLVSQQSREVKPPAGHGHLRNFERGGGLKSRVCRLFSAERLNHKAAAEGPKPLDGDTDGKFSRFPKPA